MLDHPYFSTFQLWIPTKRIIEDPSCCIDKISLANDMADNLVHGKISFRDFCDYIEFADANMDDYLRSLENDLP